MVDREERIRFWLEASDADAKAMRHLHANGDNTWALFIGHIVIEKLLKAYFAKHREGTPPLIHDLSRIAGLAGLGLDQKHLDILDTVTTFNIRARYDDYKHEFALRCTSEYTAAMIGEIEELRVWIKSRL
jgi:HEPN domain-containing protein